MNAKQWYQRSTWGAHGRSLCSQHEPLINSVTISNQYFMAAQLSVSVSIKPSCLLSKPTTAHFLHAFTRAAPSLSRRRKQSFTSGWVSNDDKQNNQIEPHLKENDSIDELQISKPSIPSSLTEKLARKKSERFTYLVAAVMSSFGITSMAVLSVYYRFSWQMEGGDVPLLEMFGTFALSVGAAVGMEFWARWAHEALWHASLWHMHESHHKPREGPFELNDVFAIINAFPAIALLSYGFFNKGLVPGLCFGAFLGWLTCLFMMVWFTRDFLLALLLRFLISERLPPPTSFITRRNSMVYHMGCFWDVRWTTFLFFFFGNLKEWEALMNWKKRSKEGLKLTRISDNCFTLFLQNISVINENDGFCPSFSFNFASTY